MIGMLQMKKFVNDDVVLKAVRQFKHIPSKANSALIRAGGPLTFHLHDDYLFRCGPELLSPCRDALFEIIHTPEDHSFRTV